MNVKCAMLTVVMVAFACAASAAELYVDDDAPADVAADGTQAKPFKTIQEAINIAGANDVINVAEGIYGEDKTLHENNTYSRVYIKNKPGENHRCRTRQIGDSRLSFARCRRVYREE